MSAHFFYVYLKFLPKIVTLTEPILRQHEVVVEVSKRLVLLRQLELVLVNENPTEKAIALDFAEKGGSPHIPNRCGTNSRIVRRKCADLV